MMSQQDEESFIFPLGTKATNNFTGQAWFASLVSDSSFNCPIYNVTFEAGTRNFWHSHPGGQILLVTSGEGYYQEKGKPRRLLKAGDIVLISQDTQHWHGATSNSRFTHLAISTNINQGEVKWLNPVTDEEYKEL